MAVATACQLPASNAPATATSDPLVPAVLRATPSEGIAIYVPGFSLGRRWMPVLLVTAILALGTLGLRHVYSDAHTSGHSPECLTCRVVSSSTAALDTHPLSCKPLAVRSILPLAHDENYISALVPAAPSRGPPPSC